jgi:hypothetical protein
MDGMMVRLLRAWSAVARTVGTHDRSSERGDVPGWVMVTVMTAGLVAAIWAVAGPELEGMLREALSSVS